MALNGLPTLNAFQNKKQSIQPDTRNFEPPKNLVKVQIVAEDMSVNDAVTQVLLNPNTITETKAANWVKHNVPGQNDPIMQYISGSERVVRFTLKLSKDLASNVTIRGTDSFTYTTQEMQNETAKKDVYPHEYPRTEAKILELIQSGVKDKLSEDRKLQIANEGLAAQVKDIYENPLVKNSPIGRASESAVQASKAAVDAAIKKEETKFPASFWPLSIEKYLEYYRLLVVPRISTIPNQNKTPPLVSLKMNGVLGDIRQGSYTRWILADYNLSITNMSPDFRPINADITLTFIEYVNESVASVPVKEFREKNSPKKSKDTIDSNIENTGSLPGLQPVATDQALA
jgi:hypothetical protein